MKPRVNAPRIANAQQVIAAFEGVRRSQSNGRYAPHKPLLILLSLARVQHEDGRMARFTEIETDLRSLLDQFGPTNSSKNCFMPFWHLSSDHDGALWQLEGPRSLFEREPGSTPTLTALRDDAVRGGFSREVHDLLSRDRALTRSVAKRVLRAFFPESLHADIAAAAGLDLDAVTASEPLSTEAPRRKRDRAFRDEVLRAYEFRCCVCGFDLRIGHQPAGLEAAHIQWHHVGGPDVVTNGLALCSLHHKLFDLGVFTIEQIERRVVFSQHAIGGQRGLEGELRLHGRPMLPPQDRELVPDARFLEWNWSNVFKRPERRIAT